MSDAERIAEMWRLTNQLIALNAAADLRRAVRGGQVLVEGGKVRVVAAGQVRR